MHNTRCWMNILLIIFVLFLLSCTEAVLPQDLSELGFYGNSQDIIHTLNSKKELSYTEHFMLAIAYKNSNEYKKAIFHFANSCFVERRAQKLTIYPQPVYNFVNKYMGRSYLYNDAVYEIAKGFMMYQEYTFVIKFIDLMKNEKTGIYREGQILKADALVQLKQFEEAQKVLLKSISKFTDIESLLWLYLKVASLYEKQDRYADAVASYENLLKTSTRSWQSQIAAKRILQIIEKNPQIQITPDTLRIVVEALYNTRNYNDIVAIDETVFSSISDNSVKRAIDTVRMKTYCQLAQSNALQKLYDIYQSDEDKNYFALIIAETLWNGTKKAEAMHWINKINTTGNDTYKKSVMYYQAMYAIHRKETPSKSVDEYVANFPDDAGTQEMLWLYAKNSITNIKTALYYLEKYYTAFGTNGKYADEVCFWLYNAKKGENPDEAEKIAYQMIAFLPHSPYTWILIDRISSRYTLEQLSSEFSMAVQTNNVVSALFTHAMITYKERDESKRVQRIALIKKSFPKANEVNYDIIPKRGSKLSLDIPDAVVTRVEHYYSIGYSEGITRELSLYSNVSPHSVYTVQYLFGLQYKQYNGSVMGLIQLLRQLNLKENIFLMHNDAIQSILPQAFLQCVKQSSEKYGVEEPFIFAVMKAESLFNPFAESSAGAIGLMQLMIPTAREIARKSGIEQVNKETMKIPCVSIELGTYYISWLMKYLKNDRTLVAAAYNAGIGNVLKWNYDNEDIFTVRTPFAETKGYIERIKKFNYQYTLVYDLYKN